MVENPLIDSPPKERPLKNAPLVCVLAQLKFPPVMSINDSTAIGAFQERVRARYPILRPEQAMAFGFGPNGPVNEPATTIWRFSDQAGWTVSLAANFLAIQTSKYHSRDDFIERFAEVVSALHECHRPPLVDRHGIRYVDQVVCENADEMKDLIRPEVLGVAGCHFDSAINHSITESIFPLGDNRHLLARWGKIPADTTVDPITVPALNQPSWVLDLDAFWEGAHDFNVDWIVTRARESAERLYTFFRWAVTENFLKKYGGDND